MIAGPMLVFRFCVGGASPGNSPIRFETKMKTASVAMSGKYRFACLSPIMSLIML